MKEAGGFRGVVSGLAFLMSGIVQMGIQTYGAMENGKGEGGGLEVLNGLSKEGNLAGGVSVSD